jgi:hypothetical protein
MSQQHGILMISAIALGSGLVELQVDALSSTYKILLEPSEAQALAESLQREVQIGCLVKTHRKD